jgi:hypothetical protein
MNSFYLTTLTAYMNAPLMYDKPSKIKYHQPICLCDCSMPKVCAACVIGNAPDQPIAQNSVALAQRHLGVRKRGREHNIAADVTIVVILITGSLANGTPTNVQVAYPNRIHNPILRFAIKPIIRPRIHRACNEHKDAIQVQHKPGMVHLT